MSTSAKFWMTLVVLILLGTAVAEAKGNPLNTKGRKKPVYFRLRSDGIPDHCLEGTGGAYCADKTEMKEEQMWSKYFFGDEGSFALRRKGSDSCIAAPPLQNKYQCPHKFNYRKCEEAYIKGMVVLWYTEPVPNTTVWEFLRTNTTKTDWAPPCQDSFGSETFAQLQIRQKGDDVEVVLSPSGRATESMGRWKFDYFCD